MFYSMYGSNLLIILHDTIIKINTKYQQDELMFAITFVAFYLDYYHYYMAKPMMMVNSG